MTYGEFIDHVESGTTTVKDAVFAARLVMIVSWYESALRQIEAHADKTNAKEIAREALLGKRKILSERGFANVDLSQEKSFTIKSSVSE